MKPGSKVRIVQLVLDPRTITGSGRPQVGDGGIILRVEHEDGAPLRYVLESMGSDGTRPSWTGQFAAEELELLPS